MALNELTAEAKRLAKEVESRCADAGFTLLVYCTYRSPHQQARLWRQSRAKAEIEAKIQKLHDRGFGFLAEILAAVGPQAGELGKHVTMAGPGESWHQYREALDAVPMVGGKPLWGTAAPQWQTYGQACRDAGLVWAGDWERFREYPHAQLRDGSNPLKTLTPAQVEEAILGGGA